MPGLPEILYDHSVEGCSILYLLYVVYVHICLQSSYEGYGQEHFAVC